jgi:hypothetical protein
MPTNRAFLLACATVVTLGLSAASSTPADAKSARSTISALMSQATPEQRGAMQAAAGAVKAAMAKQMQAAMAKQAGAMKAAMAKQMQAAMVAKQAEMEKQMKAEMAAKQAEMEKQASSAAAGVSMVPTEYPTAPAPLSEGKREERTAAPVDAKPCLTKEYLNGRAILRNNCTGEWVAAPEPITKG